MLNVVAIMGRLVADPELRTTQSGINVVSFRIACDRNFARQGEQRQADSIRTRTETTVPLWKWLPTTSALLGPKIPMAAIRARAAIRTLLRPTRTRPLPARLLWRLLPATLPATQMISPSLTTATTCRSDI